MRMQVFMENDKDFKEDRLPYIKYLYWSTLLKQESVTEFSKYPFVPLWLQWTVTGRIIIITTTITTTTTMPSTTTTNIYLLHKPCFWS